MITGLSRAAVGFFLVALAITAAIADEPKKESPPELPATIVPTDYLVLPSVGQYGRLPLQRDAVEAQLVAGTWKVPSVGETVKTPDGKSSAWTALKASDDGALDVDKFRGGYAVASFDSPAERVMMLEAAGHAMVYVNGEPRAGDPYKLGWLRLPVLVRKGQNTLLFHLSADKLKARLTIPPAKIFLLDQDRTLPTLVRGDAETEWAWGAIPIVNATNNWSDPASITCGPKEFVTDVDRIPPLSVYKQPFKFPKADPKAGGEVKYTFELKGPPLEKDADASDETLIKTTLTLKQVTDDDLQIQTFLSRIDGSVQPYAVRPAAKVKAKDGAASSAEDERPAMIVTLHDAGTSCEDHVANYSPKPWAHVVAPQGRRSFGFDWESWGRLDALQAIREAQDHYICDKRRTYLTGHSMGGHGAWHLGVARPDQFAAIGPSSSWISYWSYGGGMPSMEAASDIDARMLRAHNASDTLKLLTNLANTGIYVLHGAADQTVPIAQARFMRTRLAAFHPNFVYFEQPAADHWWGNECCDWPRMMEFFRQQTLQPAAEQTYVDFTTANPAVSSTCNWVSIEAQLDQLEPSHVAIRQNVQTRTFVGNTSNVARLAIDVAHLTGNQPIDVTLDGQSLNWLNAQGETDKLWFERQGNEWSVAGPPAPLMKGPARYGTFNSAFDNHAILVYGTAGNEVENAWAAAKARYDAETFYYRGGGALDVLPDSKFDFNTETDRNVILYGNADTNSAWPQLLSSSPVEVRRGHVRVGTRTETSDELAVIAVRPRPGSDTATVGIVSGTGPAGMRLTNRLRWYVSGIVYPDLMVLEPKTLTEGSAGVRAWGSFGLDWRTETGEIAWRNPSL